MKISYFDKLKFRIQNARFRSNFSSNLALHTFVYLKENQREIPMGTTLRRKYSLRLTATMLYEQKARAALYI